MKFTGIEILLILLSPSYCVVWWSPSLVGVSSALSHFLCPEVTHWAALDSLLGRKMFICCSHLCAMLQAFNLWDICHPQKRSSKPISGHKTVFSLDCTLMLLVSKLPIELNHLNQKLKSGWKWCRICVKTPRESIVSYLYLAKGKFSLLCDFLMRFAGFLSSSSFASHGSWSWTFCWLCFSPLWFFQGRFV
jgi:hypothetical protein